MKRGRFSDEQIIAILKEQEAGLPPPRDQPCDILQVESEVWRP
jgi:hypothetical protein